MRLKRYQCHKCPLYFLTANSRMNHEMYIHKMHTGERITGKVYIRDR